MIGQIEQLSNWQLLLPASWARNLCEEEVESITIVVKRLIAM
jgi:hypothetical protein